MPVGTPAPLIDYLVRVVRETTPGTTPAGNMQSMPFQAFNATGGAPDRGTPVYAAGSPEPAANPAQSTSYQVTSSGYQTYGDHEILEAGACGQTAYAAGDSITSTLIAAVDAGNKLTRAAGWGTLSVGDFVQGVGFVTNGALWVAPITAVSGGDLTLDTAWKNLVDEAAGPSVTISFVKDLKLGNVLSTYTAELWNPTGSFGDVVRGWAVAEWNFGFDYPGTWTNAFNGPAISLTNPQITAQLANATDAAAAIYAYESTEQFGNKVLPAYGGGFRYGGVLLPDVRIAKVQTSIKREATTNSGAGNYGPLVIFRGGIYSVQLDFSVFIDSAESREFVDDARTSATLASMSFVQIDGLGRRALYHYAGLEPNKADKKGKQVGDEEMAELSYLARADASHTCFHKTLLG